MLHQSLGVFLSCIIYVFKFRNHHNYLNPASCINSLRPSDTRWRLGSWLTHLPLVPHMCQWTGPSWVQVMTCHLFGTKPLPEPMLAYCQLDSWEQISVKFESEFYHFLSRKCIWICRLPKIEAILSRGRLVNIDSGNGLVPGSTESLPEPVLTYCQLDPQEQTSVEFWLKWFSFKKVHLKMTSADCQHVWASVCWSIEAKWRIYASVN